MKTFVIGDIHGGLKALKQVLDRSGFNNKKDKIIFLGDYVDGWSESAQVIQYLIELQKEAEGRHIFIRGNHDKWCEEWFETGIKHPYWIPQGGKATVASYISTALVGDKEHQKFFKGMHDYYIDEDNRAFIHGGFISRKGVGYEQHRADYYWDRDMWGLALMLDGREEETKNNGKYSRFRKHKEVFIGHTSTLSQKIKPHYKEYQDDRQPKNGGIMIPMNRCNVWNLDTGGGRSGKLSIMDIDTKEYWQSDMVKELYPGETTRGG